MISSATNDVTSFMLTQWCCHLFILRVVELFKIIVTMLCVLHVLFDAISDASSLILTEPTDSKTRHNLNRRPQTLPFSSLGEGQKEE